MQFDSVHGKLPIEIQKTKDGLKYKNKTIKFFSERDPSNLPWKKLKVDIVLECSGVFASKEKASAHLTAGAKKVIISAPGSNVDATIVQGVNNNILNKKTFYYFKWFMYHKLLSSCSMVLDKGVRYMKWLYDY